MLNIIGVRNKKIFKAVVTVVLTISFVTGCTKITSQQDSNSVLFFGQPNQNIFCEKVEKMAQAARSDSDMSGLSVALILEDRSLCLAAYGQADVEQNKPMTSSSRFLSGSTGKTFVATTLMYLQIKGVLKIDDLISKYLADEEFFERLPNAKDITIRHLMSHTSGLNNHVFTKGFADLVMKTVNTKVQQALLPHDLIAFGLTQNAVGKPGQKYFYSDTGYILLGMIIEKATGRDYYDVLQEAVLRPLSLYGISRSDRMFHENMAVGYDERKIFGAGFPSRSINLEGKMNWHPGSEWTGGGLVTKPEDLAKFTWFLYRGQALEGEYLKDMTTLGKVYGEKHSRLYGLGTTIIDTDYGRAYGHGGWVPGYVTRMIYYPELQLSIAIQTNGDNYERLNVLDGLIKSIAKVYAVKLGIEE